MPMLHRNRELAVVDDSRERWSTASNASSRSSSNSNSGGIGGSSSRRLMRSNGSRKLVRTNSVSSDYAKAAGTLAPSSSKGKLMLKSVVGFLSRTKSGKAGKPGSFTMTEPASPASASSLSRTNSETSAQDGSNEDDTGRGGQTGASRPRVSFEPEVQTVYIEQMKEEEVRNTFYCRSEYAAFKEAYRTHRDTSSDWCRGNDVLPCSCDACRDDLVEGGDNGQHIYSAARPDDDDDDSAAAVDATAAAAAAASPAADSPLAEPDHDNYDSAFEEDPALPPSPFAYGHKDKGTGGAGGEEEKEEKEQQQQLQPYEPPSPVGAVFQDAEDTSSNSSCSSRGGSSRTTVRKPSPRAGAAAAAAAAPAASSYYVTRRRRPSAHKRRGTWGVGSVPIATGPPVGRSHNRGGSLDDWRVSASVQEAVKCHGEGYAYKTLRLQGFSDLYIRTHFLPEG